MKQKVRRMGIDHLPGFFIDEKAKNRCLQKHFSAKSEGETARNMHELREQAGKSGKKGRGADLKRRDDFIIIGVFLLLEEQRLEV